MANGTLLNPTNRAKIWVASGPIGNARTGAMLMHGIATVIRISDHIVQIDYQYTVTTASTSNHADWGLNANMIHILNSDIPVITPFQGGEATLYNKDGTNWYPIPSSFNGYSGTNVPRAEFWTFGRNYNGSSIDTFTSDLISVQTRIVGTCYGYC